MAFGASAGQKYAHQSTLYDWIKFTPPKCRRRFTMPSLSAASCAEVEYSYSAFASQRSFGVIGACMRRRFRPCNQASLTKATIAGVQCLASIASNTQYHDHVVSGGNRSATLQLTITPPAE